MRRLSMELLERRAMLAAATIELGPSDNIALDQPRVAIELAFDSDPGPGETWESIGPTVFNTFLLDTGANSVLAMATAVQDMNQTPGKYATQGAFVEQGVAGTHDLDISIAYRFDFAGTSGVRQTLNQARILSDAANDFSTFGPWGIVGMPAMVDRVTSLDMRGWANGGLGLNDLYMKVDFADAIPAEDVLPGASHRYSVLVDTRLKFDPLEQVVSGSPPIWGDVPFLTAIPQHRGMSQEGNFLFDTGAQISVISEKLAIAIGLDSNGDGTLNERDASYVTTETVGGIGGQISAPVFAIDEVRLPAKQVQSELDVELVWTDLQWLVLDIPTPDDQPSLDGVFGSDLLTSGWFHAFFYPGQPDGYIDRIHFDFREMNSGSGTLYFDLNPSVDKIVVPGPGIRIRQTVRATEVVEGGDTDVYTLSLQTVPKNPVTINVKSDAQTEVSIDGGVTYSQSVQIDLIDITPQTVTVRAIDDEVLEGNHTGVIAHTVASSDPDYANIQVPDITVQIGDNDLKLIKLSSDSLGQNAINSIAVTEGETVTYWLSLETAPTSEIWVLIEDTTGQATVLNPNNPLGDPNFDNVFIFSAGNWNEPQPVKLTATDDTLKEGLHTTQLVHSVLDITNFLEPLLGQNNLTVQITDNDLGGVAIAQSGVNTTMAEGGAGDTYQLQLKLPPNGPVEITVAANGQGLVSSDGGKTFAPATTLMITDTTPQTITVTSVDDAIVEGAHQGSFRHTISGTINDTRYPSNLAIGDVTAAITDNDTAGLLIVATNDSTTVTEGGAADRYSVALRSQPTDPVTIFLSNADRQVTAVDDNQPANEFLTFGASNWNVPQIVRVTAIDDQTVEPLYSGHIVHSLISADDDYHGQLNVQVAVTDNDVVQTWHNSQDRYDVSGDGSVAPLDALVIINELNLRKYSQTDGSFLNSYATGSYYYDVNRDTYCTSADVLMVINYLNNRATAEGESNSSALPWVDQSFGSDDASRNEMSDSKDSHEIETAIDTLFANYSRGSAQTPVARSNRAARRVGIFESLEEILEGLGGTDPGGGGKL